MGKKAPPAAAPPAAKKGGEAPPKKKALSSEIDDIFSSKPKPAAAPAAAQGLGVAVHTHRDAYPLMPRAPWRDTAPHFALPRPCSRLRYPRRCNG